MDMAHAYLWHMVVYKKVKTSTTVLFNSIIKFCKHEIDIGSVYYVDWL